MSIPSTAAASPGPIPAGPIPAGRILARLWHVGLAVTFVVAYLSGDMSTFGNIHLAAGYGVLAILALRLVVGVFSRADSPLALPRPRMNVRRKLMVAVMLLAALAAAASGLGAVGVSGTAMHATIANVALGVATLHMTIMLCLFAA